ncbi:SLOG family protein [Streptomyces sp. MB22_4]|uniref:SLOG family protein n=1 Tax=Streptomyces sp. MB22_4 TaxID=3383120 RepID=UPI0039A1D473
MATVLIGLTGSRKWTDVPLLETTLFQVWHDAIEDGYNGIELIHGDARDGADAMGDAWAAASGVPRRRRPADWEGPCGPECQPGHRKPKRNGRTYCPLAGRRRNQQIVDERPLLLVAAQVNQSTGTADCMRRAKAAGIPVYRIPV